MGKPVDDGRERQRLATVMTIVGVVGVTAISVVALILLPRDDARNVLTAVLPLFASWIATVLAYYFARENLQAATDSVTTLVASNRGPASLSITDKMIDLSQIVSLSSKFGASLNQTTLDQVLAFLSNRQVNRAPFFNTDGSIAGVIHVSVIDQYLRNNAQPAGQVTFAAIKALPIALAFAVLPTSATIADARTAMSSVPNCEDVFVTQDGNPAKPVVGWLTDNIILTASR